MSEIKVVVNMLHSNAEIALENKKLFDGEGIFVLNLMSSPGSGKTSLLEKLIPKLKSHIKIAVIEGDIYTTKDAERIEAQGIPVVQINTSGACHLDGDMIREAALHFELREIDLIIIENVGNLVCPAEFEVGEDVKFCVLSVTEGNDKPLKYPLIFEKSSVVILNKMDLLQFTDFDTKEFYKNMEAINPKAKIFETSCREDRGIEALSQWILAETERKNKF